MEEKANKLVKCTYIKSQFIKSAQELNLKLKTKTG